MKRWLVILVFVSMSFISASVEIHNYSVDSGYSPLETINGEINLTIVDESYDAKIVSNDGGSVGLGEFLNLNGVVFECSPLDCLNGYDYSDGVEDKMFSVSALDESYVGFVLSGGDIVLDSLDFKIESDFGESSRRPLEIEFFEEEDWKFSEFSDSFLGRNYGCYDLAEGVVGQLVGPSPYCEMVSISDTGVLKVGADVSGSDVKGLNMTVYPESGAGVPWECSYNPSSEDGCLIVPYVGDILSAGDYQVCVSSEVLVYRIYEESEGENCGFVYEVGSGESVKDYSIFAQEVKYADSDFLNLSFSDESIIYAANNFISKRYGGDCSDGCVLPIAFSGVSQNVRIYDMQLVYTKDLEWDSLSEIYDLTIIPAKVDFSGVLDLGALGFVISKAMNYVVSLGDVIFFEENFEILPAPIISSVLPRSSPAGVPVKFYSDVYFEGSKSLSYKWDFGDNETAMTNVSFVSHRYASLGNYALSLEVSAGGDLVSMETFNIEVVSPKVAINTSLIFKRRALDDVVFMLTGLPSWYGDELSKFINVDFFRGELDRLEKERDNSFVEQDFIGIVEELYDLNVPIRVGTETSRSSYLMTDLDDVNIEPVEIIGGGVSGDSSGYANSILNWQSLNIDAGFVTKKFLVSLWNGESEEVFRVYSFDVSSKSDRESYFVINRPFDELYFKEDVGARKAGDASVIILDGGVSKSFEFYYKDAEPTTVFVSPKLGSIVVKADIDTSCNHNLVCEEERGENSDNCRSDCKPVKGVVVYTILSLVFILILYSVLQVWYKKNYEGHLFKDSRQLYNLLMYVTNARARGRKDLKIKADLRAKGWSSERVNYVIKKSRGERTGLYEIIPIERVFAYFRNRKAKKKANIATGGRRQIGRNINKSAFRKDNL